MCCHVCEHKVEIKKQKNVKVDSWLASLDADTRATAHLEAAAQATNPAAPAVGGVASAGAAVHWIDLDSPYEVLPESWKAKNRSYAKMDPIDAITIWAITI